MYIYLNVICFASLEGNTVSGGPHSSDSLEVARSGEGCTDMSNSQEETDELPQPPEDWLHPQNGQFT